MSAALAHGLCEKHAPTTSRVLTGCWGCSREDETALVGDLLAALKLAVRYLKHPDVQAIPFAAPVGVAVDRARAAIAKAERP